MVEEKYLQDDVCEVFCFDEEKVNRLKPEVRELHGVGEIFKALGDETRCRIVYALAREALCVCDLSHILGISVQAVSYHLRTLRNLRLVKHRKAGKLVFYSLDDQHIAILVSEAMAHVKEER